MFAESAPVDPMELLQGVRNIFREGNYEAVERMAIRLLDAEPSALVRAEALQYLGASLELLGRTDEAEEQFEVLLTIQPQFHMNQADFPTEVISLFESVRYRVQDRLDQIEDRRRRTQDSERREREQRWREQYQRILDLARPRYLLREEDRSSLIVALLPFGAGQFQNGQDAKGFAFFGTELGLTSASMVVWLLGTLAPDVRTNERAQELYQGYQISSYVVYGALLVSVVWGIIDSVVTFVRNRRRGTSWREVSDEEIPEDLRIEVDPELRDFDPLNMTPSTEP